MNNNRKLVGIATSAVLAVVGATLLVLYVNGAEERATKGEELVSVLVADQAIAKGTPVADLAGAVRSEKVPAKVVADGAVASLDSLGGQTTLVDMVAGEQLVVGRFGSAAAAAASTEHPGKLEVTISLEPVRTVGGTIRTGDTVGVVVSFDDPDTTHLVLHKVPVTDVRDAPTGAAVTAGGDSAAPTVNLLITLALDAPSVEKVVYAAEHGRVWLAREPLAAVEAGTQVLTRDGLGVAG